MAKEGIVNGTAAERPHLELQAGGREGTGNGMWLLRPQSPPL